MATSGTRSFIRTRNEIIAAAWRKVTGSQGSPTDSTALNELQEALNILVQAWQNEDVFLWSQSDDLQLMTEATASYTLDAGILDIDNVFWRHDGSDTFLTRMTREEYEGIEDKDAPGTPTHYYIDQLLAAPVLRLWPVYAYGTGCVVGSDTNNYLCILDHTSALATTYPITGTAYSTYWESTSETGVAHADATAYYSGHVRFTKLLRLQDFAAAGNNPDFPVAFYRAAIYGLAADIAPEYGVIGVDYDRLELKAKLEFEKAKAANSERGNVTFSPRLR